MVSISCGKMNGETHLALIFLYASETRRVEQAHHELSLCIRLDLEVFLGGQTAAFLQPDWTHLERPESSRQVLPHTSRRELVSAHPARGLTIIIFPLTPCTSPHPACSASFSNS